MKKLAAELNVGDYVSIFGAWVKVLGVHVVNEDSVEISWFHKIRYCTTEKATWDVTYRPTIVCLCGSTRFRAEYVQAFYDEEHAGRVSLTCPCYKDDPCCKTAEDHARLDALHMCKIEMADEIVVINVNGYIDESTKREIAYAESLNKVVRYLKP